MKFVEIPVSMNAFSAFICCYAVKIVFGQDSAPDTAEGAYDAPHICSQLGSGTCFGSAPLAPGLHMALLVTNF